MDMLGKKGAASHIEMIISFILFFGFVTFLLLYVRPYERPIISDSILVSLHDNFLSSNQVNLTKIFLEATPGKDCFRVSLGDVSGNSIARTAPVSSGEYEKTLPSELSSGVLSVNSDRFTTEYFYILVSPEFARTQAVCNEPMLEPDKYDIGFVEKSVLLSGSKILAMKSDYSADYAGLKSGLKIPATVDFSIVAGEYTMESTVPEGVNVKAREYSENVLLANGTVVDVNFIIKVW